MGEGTTTVGALIVELRSNSAQFRAEMEAAGRKTQDVGKHAVLSGQSLSRFGAMSIEAVTGLEGSRVVMEKVIQAGAKATGVLGQMARGGLLVGAALGGYWLGNVLSQFRELRNEGMGFVDALKLAAGATKSYEDRLKELVAEEKQFIEQIGTAQAMRLSFAKKAIQADADIAASGRQLAGDELGAAQATMEGKLSILEVEKKEATKNILDQARAQKITTEQKVEMLGLVERQYIKDRNATYMKGSLDIQKIEQATAQKQLQTWQETTNQLVDQLKARVEARKSFDSQLGQGGFGGGSAAGFGEARGLASKIKKEALDLAGLERLGMVNQSDVAGESEEIRRQALSEADALRQKYAAFPPVLEAIDRAVKSVEFGNFGREMAAARIEAARLVPTDQQLAESLGAVSEQMARMPAAMDPAGAAARKLAVEYNDLAWSVYSVREQLAALSGEDRAAAPAQ